MRRKASNPVRLRFPVSDRTRVTEGPKPKRVDVVLQRTAWISQIALVIAAILGYIYTIRPIHQKQLLDEQIAERTVQLKSATTTLAKLQSEAARLRRENVQLGNDAKATYERLRSDLALKLIGLSNVCTPWDDDSLRSSNDMADCVIRFAKTQIAEGLKAEDRTILLEIVEDHRKVIVASDRKVVKTYAAKARHLARDLKRTRADIKRAEPDVRAEILKLRIARANGRPVEPDPPTGRIIIRTEEDQKAYDRYSERYMKLVERLNDLNHQKTFFDVDVHSARGKALDKTATQMHDEFTRRTGGH